MQKAIIGGIIVGTMAITGVLIYGGMAPVLHPESTPPEEREVLPVPFREASLGLEPADIEASVWEQIEPHTVSLMPQVMALPWGTANVPEVTVRAFHNGRQIFFRLEWADSTENREHQQNVFTDACAIMFPFTEEPGAETLMMGFGVGANIWAWKAVRDTQVFGQPAKPERAYSDYYNPFVEREVYRLAQEKPERAVEDLVSVRIGTLTRKPYQLVEGRGLWSGDRWKVMFIRNLGLHDSRQDAFIPIGQQRAVSFAVWDGAQGDRGARKSLSNWVWLDLGPAAAPATAARPEAPASGGGR